MALFSYLGRTPGRPAPFGVLLTGMGTAAVVAATLVPAAGVPSLAIPLAVLLAAGGFSTNPAVNAQVYGILGETPTLGGVMNVVAFNVGVAVAPWVSGLVIDAAPAWRASAGSARPSPTRRSRAHCWTGVPPAATSARRPPRPRPV